MGITQREANFKFNMKLIAGLFAAVLAIDCPNDGWEANSDDNECIPATNTVSITCNADTMVVTLDARHLYVEMDASHVDEAESAAFVGSCTSSTYNSASGTYTITVPLDDCGTDVSQTGGEITFANTIYGSDGAITVAVIQNSDLQALLQSDEVQSVLNAPKASDTIKRSTKKNPLANTRAMLKLNPNAATEKRAAWKVEEAAKKAKN